MKRQLILPSKHLRVLLSGGVKTSQLSTAFFPCYLCHLLQVAVAPAPEPCGREISFFVRMHWQSGRAQSAHTKGAGHNPPSPQRPWPKWNVLAARSTKAMLGGSDCALGLPVLGPRAARPEDATLK
jgi:hypothetical protein